MQILYATDGSRGAVAVGELLRRLVAHVAIAPGHECLSIEAKVNARRRSKARRAIAGLLGILLGGLYLLVWLISRGGFSLT